MDATQNSDLNKGYKVPPPPDIHENASPHAEVTIRTMASDIASVAQSGGAGGIVQPETVSLSSKPAAYSPRLNFLPWILILIGVLGFLFVLGYFLVPFLLSLKNSGTSGLEPNASQYGSSKTSEVPPLNPPSPAGELSFKTPADQTFSMTIGSASTAEDLRPWTEQLASTLSSADPASAFFQVVYKNQSGSSISFNDLLLIINAPLLDPKFVDDAFGPEFLFFVYKDKNGYWPGYVLKMKKDKTSILVRPLVAELEKATTSFQNLFLKPPGAPRGDFTYSKMIDQQIRVLEFGNGSTTLSYGWFYGNYLVISASLDGMKEAVQRL